MMWEPVYRISVGQQIPLEQLATIDFKDGPNQIQRDDAK